MWIRIPSNIRPNIRRTYADGGKTGSPNSAELLTCAQVNGWREAPTPTAPSDPAAGAKRTVSRGMLAGSILLTMAAVLVSSPPASAMCGGNIFMTCPKVTKPGDAKASKRGRRAQTARRGLPSPR